MRGGLSTDDSRRREPGTPGAQRAFCALYGGNLSAAVAEGVRRIHEEEGREALVAWLGEAGDATVGARDALRAEWQGKGARPAKRRKVQ